jgi:ribonuclease PH
VVANERGELLEIQGTAEGSPFSRAELDSLLTLAEGGIQTLMGRQREALAQAPAEISKESV